MRMGRLLAGCLSAMLLASCGGKIKAPGTIAYPSAYNPADPNHPGTLTPHVTSPSARPTGVGTVQGQVRDLQGRGMGNVAVMVDGSQEVAATTAFDGSFTLANVPAGWQFITFQYEGQTFAGAVDVAPNQATAMEPVTFAEQFSGFGNQASGSFELPRKTLLYTWKITNVAAWSGSIYVTAADGEGALKNGSVFRLDTRQGKKWTQIGDKFFGLTKPLTSTVSGLAAVGEQLFAADAKKGLYKLDPIKGKPKRVDKTGYRDVAAGGGKVYVAGDSGLVGGSTSLDDLMPLSGITATGGIGADVTGTLYAVSGNKIVKYQGKAETFAEGLNSPIDVAADRQGFVYVMEPTGFKRFDRDGKLVGIVPVAMDKPVSICVDESGAVYLADQGLGNAPSKVLRFSPAAVATTPPAGNDGQNDPYDPYSGYGDDEYDPGSY